MRRSISLTALLVSVLALALPALAAANATSDRIYADCEHSASGALTGTYTKGQLRSALNNLPSDVSEYSGCYDAIQQQLRGGGHRGASGAGGGGGTGSSGSGGAGGGADGSGGTGATAGEGAPSGPPHVGTKVPVRLAGTPVHPGAAPSIGGATRELPTTLVVLLVLLAGGALAFASTTVGRRVVAHRRA